MFSMTVLLPLLFTNVHVTIKLIITAQYSHEHVTVYSIIIVGDRVQNTMCVTDYAMVPSKFEKR